jgi:hypothetical protein
MPSAEHAEQFELRPTTTREQIGIDRRACKILRASTERRKCRPKS